MVTASLSLAAGIILLAQQGELRRLKEEVRRGRAELHRLDAQRVSARDTLTDYRRRAAGIDALLSALQEEEASALRELTTLQQQRDSLSNALDRTRSEVDLASRAIVRAKLAIPPSSALLMPKEAAAAEIRGRLVDRWTRSGRRYIESLNRAALSIASKDSSLRQELEARGALVSRRRMELAGMLQRVRGAESSLELNDAERRALARLVEQRSREAHAIESLIARSAAHASRTRETMPNKPPVAPRTATPQAKRVTPSDGAKVERRRSTARRSASSPGFRWPSSSRVVVERYGERRNPRTGTVTMNPGINIGSPAGSSALAAADGTVSLVSWLPSYGTIIIVEHEDGWRTVYGNLAGASVTRGTRVRAGQSIGRVGASIDGDLLHFEVWNGGERVNPATVVP